LIMNVHIICDEPIWRDHASMLEASPRKKGDCTNVI
jgi:hypothetical protein